MRKPKPKTNGQVGRMFGLAKPLADKCDMDTGDYLRDLAHSVTSGRTSSLKELTFDEANQMITSLGGDQFRAYGKSYRNENHKKQEAGIKTVETEAHVTAIREAAALRNMGEQGLESLATRMRLPWPPHTTEQGNKIFEAIKKMNERDNIVTFPTRKPQPATPSQPAFRRVA